MSFDETVVQDVEQQVEPAVEAPAQETVAEPEVDWRARFEEETRAKAGILNELREQRAEQRRVMENLEALRQMALQREQVEPPPLPDKSEAPVDYLDQRIGQVAQTVEQLAQQQRQQQEAAAAAAMREEALSRLQAIQEAGAQAAEKIKTQIPDYAEALSFGLERAKLMLQAQGVPEAEIPQQLYAWEIKHNARCLQEGKDPAREAYAMFQKLGYTPKAAAAAAAKRAPVSLSNVSGARPKSRLTVDDVKRLPKEERLRIFADRNKFDALGRQGYIDI